MHACSHEESSYSLELRRLRVPMNKSVCLQKIKIKDDPIRIGFNSDKLFTQCATVMADQ